MKRDLLIIEKNTRDSLAGRLFAEGYSVCLALTGTEALEALKRHKITHTVVLNAISMRSNGDKDLCLSEESSSQPSYIGLF